MAFFRHQRNKKREPEILSTLKDRFERNTERIMSLARDAELKGLESESFQFYLIAMLRKTSFNYMFSMNKFLIESSGPPEELAFLNSPEHIANTFMEIIIFLYHLAASAFLDVQLKKAYTDETLPNLPDPDEFRIMDDVLTGIGKAYMEFCGLLDLDTDDGYAEKFLATYKTRFSEYAKMEYSASSEKDSPKGTLFWEGAKKIATTMVGGPDFVIITAINLASVDTFATLRDFIAKFYGVPSF